MARMSYAAHVAVRPGLWAPNVDGPLLAAARGSRGHTQTECAAVLREMGLQNADQSSVSKWEAGARGAHPGTSRILRRYIEDSGVGQGPINADDVVIDDLARRLGDEPLLGERQAKAVDAVIEHVRTLSTPMTESDLQAWRDIVRVLRL